MDILAAQELPTLTLYTKDPCPLCDELVDELNRTFHGRFQLKKVDITHRGNLKYLRLYRYDIPVLYLNGQFLCMHRLNSELLNAKLTEIETLRGKLYFYLVRHFVAKPKLFDDLKNYV